MKNKIIFVCLDILLVFVVGIILGLTFKNHIFDETTGTLAFISLLIVLICPSILYWFKTKLSSGMSVCLFIFVGLEIVLNIIFIGFSSAKPSVFSILQLLLISYIIVAFMINYFFYENEEKKKTNKK